MIHWNSVKTACLEKVWFSSYSQKCFSANEISVFFNHQYLVNRLISDFDFWHINTHEWKEQGLLTGLLKKKKSHLGKWAILCPKMAHPHNTESTVRFFKNFCTMEWANSLINDNNLFQEMFCLGQMVHFQPQSGASS